MMNGLLILAATLVLCNAAIYVIFWRIRVIRRNGATLLRDIRPTSVRDTGHLGTHKGSNFRDLSDPETVLVLIEDRIRTATGWTDLGDEIMSLIKLHKQQKGNK